MGCRQSKKEKLEEGGDDTGAAAEAAEATADGPKLVVVFGATATQGGSVARALKEAEGYKVRAVSRDPESEKAKALSEEGIEVVKADLNDAESIKKILEGAYGVFAITSSGFDDEAAEKEIQQGKHVVDAAKECGVKHFIYAGSEDVQEAIGKRCRHMDAKAAVEKYIKEQDVPFTCVRPALFFENLLDIPFFIRKEEETVVLDVPMGDHALPMIGGGEIGSCVKAILDDLEEYKGKALCLAADNLKVEEYAATLTKRLDDKKVIGTTKSAEDFAKMDIPGAADLAIMYEFLCHEDYSEAVTLTRKLSPEICTFEKWVENNKDALQKLLDKSSE